MAKMKTCPVCGQKVGIDKLESHVKKVHPREKVDINLDQDEQKEIKAAMKAYKPSARPRGRWIILIVAVVVVIVVLAMVLIPRGLGVGDVPPDFTLTDNATRQDWHLGNHIADAKPILLEFFHPQCSACISEVQTSSSPLRVLYSDYATTVEFVSIAITLEVEGFTNPPTFDMVNSFITQYPTPWTYLVETSGTTVRTLYQVTGTPTFYLIGMDGKIAYKNTGAGDLSALRSAIISELTP
jgi:thiol-disulfide isomerase/thioredoxin